MEERNTTYDGNKLITFGEYKTFFTRGSDYNFVADTEDIFDYMNIDLLNGSPSTGYPGVPDFNKVICTKDFLNPADFNFLGNKLPTDTSKCLRNIDLDNILGGSLTFHIIVTQSDTSTYFKILNIEGDLENSKIYNSTKPCYLRIRVELDNEPFDLNLCYLKLYTGSYYITYFEWAKLVGIFNNIKLTGISWYRDGNNSSNINIKDFIHVPYVYVYIGRNGSSTLPGSSLVMTWIDNTETQAGGLSEYGGPAENEIPNSGGGGSGGGSGSEVTIPSNALVYKSNWHVPSYLYEHDNTEAIIYGILVQDYNDKYHLLTYENKEPNITNEVYFTYFDYTDIVQGFNPEVTNKFYAFKAIGNGPNSHTRISIYEKVSGGYDYLYDRDYKLYDKNFNVID